MSLEDFESKLDRLLRAGKRDADVIQFSGGEPTIHPEVEAMVDAAFARGVRKVYLNTNGIRIAQDRDFVERLARHAGRLQLYLQFDGVRPDTHHQLRAARGLLAVKERAIENALEYGLFVLPVMTVARGINLDEIGDVVRLARKNFPGMNTVMLQPAFSSGRYESGNAGRRLTVGEMAAEVERQTDGMFAKEDFGPIPCSDPNCFSFAAAVVKEGRLIPISRYLPPYDTWAAPDTADLVARFSDRLPQHMLGDELLDALLNLLGGGDDGIDWSDYRSFFTIAIKPFMDAECYDQDRVDACCVHIVDRNGDPVSFCEYNAIRRPTGLL